MSAPINRLPNVSTTLPSEKILAVARTPMLRRDQSEDRNAALYEDPVDTDAGAHLQHMPSEIDLSLLLIHALVHNELPDEAVTALAHYAPLGDLSGAVAHCDAIEQKGLEYVTWSKHQSLAQTLAFMAS